MNPRGLIAHALNLDPIELEPWVVLALGVLLPLGVALGAHWIRGRR